MKKFMARATKMALVLMMAFALIGCGEKTLEDYVNENPEIQAEIDQVSEMSNDTQKIGVAIKDNTVTYTYTYTQTYDAETLEQMKELFESSKEAMAKEFKAIIEELEKDTDIKGVTIETIYNNGDGSEIFKAAFN